MKIKKNHKLTCKKGGDEPVVLELDDALPLPKGEGGVKAEKLPGGVGWVVLACPLPDRSEKLHE